jgi:hypothetical protein
VARCSQQLRQVRTTTALRVAHANGSEKVARKSERELAPAHGSCTQQIAPSIAIEPLLSTTFVYSRSPGAHIAAGPVPYETRPATEAQSISVHARALEHKTGYRPLHLANSLRAGKRTRTHHRAHKHARRKRHARAFDIGELGNESRDGRLALVARS